MSIKSIEPQIADLGNSWLRKYKLDYKLEQESLNTEIDRALSEYFSKKGGSGANRPDVKLLLRDDNLEYYPILIEYKGHKNRLVKLDVDNQVENLTMTNEPNYRNINTYAINGSVHYANALLHHTSYTDVISIGMTGYINEFNDICYEIEAYYVSKKNFGVGQKIGSFTDFSFLADKHFSKFIERVKLLNLSEYEIEKLREKKEREIETSLSKLNNDIYYNEKGLGEDDRVYLVAATIISTIGIPGKVSPLKKSDLRSSNEIGNRDGDILIRKIKAFLKAKNLPRDKYDLIVRRMENTILMENINRAYNGESQLKRVFTKIVDDLGIYYKIGLTTDFTGKLFNEMYGWLGFSQDKLNDVVLTPSYVATLLAKLARVDKDTYVWDFAAGSAGLLVAAMNEMLIDARNTIKSPEKLIQKELEIKASQLLGLELLPSVYMLAILNMILMGDGSSTILNMDSLIDFDGYYKFKNKSKKFPANAFVLNPPYSAKGNGMVFVEKALSLMDKGYASILIQNSAGSGRATEYNKRILEKNSLVASIKMPIDIFVGKSSVQTYIYVFKINEKHHQDNIVKFIDFSNDGYERTSRKKASINLRDTGDAKERYEELVNLVRFGKKKLSIFDPKDYYEGTIDPLSGNDWNQSGPIEAKVDSLYLDKMVSNFISWEVNNQLEKETVDIEEKLENTAWRNFKLEELFYNVTDRKYGFKTLKYKVSDLPKEPKGIYNLPALTAGVQNQGLSCYVPKEEATVLQNVISISANGKNTGVTFFQSQPFTVLQDAYAIDWKNKNDILHNNHYLFLTGVISNTIFGNYEWTNKAGWNRIKSVEIKLPIDVEGKIDFQLMYDIIDDLKVKNLNKISNLSI